MNDNLIVTIYVVIDDGLKYLNQTDHRLAQVNQAEVLTVAVVAAKYFQNNHERALYVMQGIGYLSGTLSVSRFNRRLHALSECLMALLDLLGDLFAQGEVFIIDSMPLPVCRRVRARRCTKVQGRAYYGYCAAHKTHYFGWKLHLTCTSDGVPVAFDKLPAAYHDLTPIHELTVGLPPGTCVVADKAYNSYPDELYSYLFGGVRIVARRRQNMSPNSASDALLLQQHRSTVETVNSQLEKMGVQRLHARTTIGFDVKLYASLLALVFTNGI